MEFLPGHHRGLRLVNFTVFSDASFEFVPGVNVFVGENGTGKTHALKALYALKTTQRPLDPPDSEPLANSVWPLKLVEIFGIRSDEELHRFNPVGNAFDIVEEQGPVSAFLSFCREEVGSGLPEGPADYRPGAIFGLGPFETGGGTFIPASDMLGHTLRFLATWERYRIDFDRTHRDLVLKLLSPELRDLGILADLEGKLGELLGGDLVLEDERFFLITKYGKIPAPVLAEGIRKIATLKRLIETDNFSPGSVLYWDEPEVNLNPKLMDEVVDAILTLARSGVQVFLATHSYVILQELSLQSGDDGLVRYFSFAPNEEGTVVRHFDTVSALDPDPIMEQYESLLERGLDRAFGPAPTELTAK